MLVRRILANGALSVASVCVTFVVLEAALRVYHGELLDFTSELPPPPNRVEQPFAVYDSLLGWVPRADWREPMRGESVGPEGFRSNGAASPAGEPAVVAVGDSFTYGDEVADGATWPAHLSRELGRPVLNAGVFAYGVDQAVLRAERVLAATHPEWVVLAFIGDDVRRAELSYYAAWKPYFTVDSSGLGLHNVPVPRAQAPEPGFAGARRALGYSVLASALARRLAPEWWHYTGTRREHTQGSAVTALLVRRLDGAARERGARLLVVGLATGGTIGSNEGVAEVLAEVAGAGVATLDLIPQTLAMSASVSSSLFMARGHYAPELNAWVAARIRQRLVELDSALADP